MEEPVFVRFLTLGVRGIWRWRCRVSPSGSQARLNDLNWKVEDGGRASEERTLVPVSLGVSRFPVDHHVRRGLLLALGACSAFQVLPGAASMQAPYNAYWNPGEVQGFGNLSNGVSV